MNANLTLYLPPSSSNFTAYNPAGQFLGRKIICFGHFRKIKWKRRSCVDKKILRGREDPAWTRRHYVEEVILRGAFSRVEENLDDPARMKKS